jgi:hypothetical protein
LRDFFVMLVNIIHAKILTKWPFLSKNPWTMNYYIAEYWWRFLQKFRGTCVYLIFIQISNKKCKNTYRSYGAKQPPNLWNFMTNAHLYTFWKSITYLEINLLGKYYFHTSSNKKCSTIFRRQSHSILSIWS